MKYCIDCGCNLPDDHDGDMCECCRDDRGDTIPDGLREIESLYPKVCLPTLVRVGEDLDKILESRLSELVKVDLYGKPKVNLIFRGYGQIVVREGGKYGG